MPDDTDLIQEAGTTMARLLQSLQTFHEPRMRLRTRLRTSVDDGLRSLTLTITLLSHPRYVVLRLNTQQLFHRVELHRRYFERRGYSTMGVVTSPQEAGLRSVWVTIYQPIDCLPRWLTTDYRSRPPTQDQVLQNRQ